MIRKDAWLDLNFLNFTEAWFVTQDVIYPGVIPWEGTFINNHAI